MSGTQIEASKLNTATVVVQGDQRASKLNTATVLSQADMRASKIVTYLVLMPLQTNTNQMFFGG